MIGGAETRDQGCDADAAIRSIRRGLEAGLSCIDTAEIYAGGFTEELVGAAIRGYPRDRLQIISKVSSRHLRHDDVLRSAAASLERLGTDYLDVYVIHKPTPDIPLPETMQAMQALQEKGLIRHIGVSNFSVGSLARARQYLEAPIVLNQVHYNLIYREPERSGLLEYCRDNDIFLMAWRPLEKGAIPENPPAVLNDICTRYERTPARVAINWLVSQSHVVTLSTMQSEQHLRDNLGAMDWTLRPEDIELLRSQFPGQHSVSNREPLL